MYSSSNSPFLSGSQVQHSLANQFIDLALLRIDGHLECPLVYPGTDLKHGEMELFIPNGMLATSFKLIDLCMFACLAKSDEGVWVLLVKCMGVFQVVRSIICKLNS